MARADRRREQRAKAAPVPRRSDVVIEDTMFFPRLRRHAKWMFVLLALAFVLGFTLFGVGAGGVGVGDILKGSGGSGVPSISNAEQRTFEHPKDAQAFRDLSTAYQAKARLTDAATALETYTQLRPKDMSALRELASLYLRQASTAGQRAQILQYREQYLAPGALIGAAYTLGNNAPNPDPITNAITSGYDDQIQTAYGEAQSASGKAVGVYQKIVAASPKDPALRLELAQAAQTAGDNATAIKAFETFLKLAPDDPTAPDVKRLLKQLRSSGSTR